MSENDRFYTRLAFVLFATWVCIPVALFVLKIISKPMAYLIFAGFAIPVIVYCLLTGFRDEEDSSIKVDQAGLKIAESEIKTVPILSNEFVF